MYPSQIRLHQKKDSVSYHNVLFVHVVCILCHVLHKTLTTLNSTDLKLRENAKWQHRDKDVFCVFCAQVCKQLIQLTYVNADR